MENQESKKLTIINNIIKTLRKQVIDEHKQIVGDEPIINPENQKIHLKWLIESFIFYNCSMIKLFKPSYHSNFIIVSVDSSELTNHNDIYLFAILEDFKNTAIRDLEIYYNITMKNIVNVVKNYDKYGKLPNVKLNPYEHILNEIIYDNYLEMIEYLLFYDDN